MPQNALEKLVQANDGVLRVSAAIKLGISAPTVYTFVRRRGLDRLSKGVYADPNGWHDEMWLTSLRWPRAVFSHHSALLVHSLTDREPASLSVTVPSGYNASTLRETGVQAFYIKPDLLDMGKTDATTPDGHTVPCYNLERTICDVLRSRSSIDPQVLTSALQSYVRRSDKQLGLLSSYAEKLGMSGLVTQYLKVLL
ncbi:type IV toxin-antitoxin system AbiEi family antitoxin domain-containing protein [Schaalia sp. ZJ405]|uniref:type IV toxin-antitoxin system AbiEi family antitoxin domain-containing protein n=1 Tax=Schaalia sp. ZJ405 TaxID=2709403 RepID=UPI0013ECE489|nr:type IV toxin-antitoxin system AbiEi family antitoxin domain-containing protein [Schaalia sp. ZJ405]QPK82318.1 type IV toxin-antitoxin system AbiEi family antitoxin domain-containing protein [Schaalia sp. ZJ405]